MKHNKSNITVDKDNPLLTNSGYLVSTYFSNALDVKKQMNLLG